MELYELRDLAFDALYQTWGLLGQLKQDRQKDRRYPETVRRVRGDSIDRLRAALLQELGPCRGTQWWPFFGDWHSVLFPIIDIFSKKHPAVFEDIDVRVENACTIVDRICELLDCREDEKEKLQACQELCSALHINIPRERYERRRYAA
jgi:hypothetical protein